MINVLSKTSAPWLLLESQVMGSKRLKGQALLAVTQSLSEGRTFSVLEKL